MLDVGGLERGGLVILFLSETAFIMHLGKAMTLEIVRQMVVSELIAEYLTLVEMM
jgi:hypothetical protein